MPNPVTSITGPTRPAQRRIRRHLGAVLTLVVCVVTAQAPAAASSDETHPSVAAYVRAGMSEPSMHWLSTEEGAPALSRVFGVAYGENNSARPAFVFVLERLPGGRGFRELARSKPFDFSDASGRTDIEALEAQSDTRFSLQINARSACGVYVTRYRFAQRESPAVWGLTGMDTQEPACGRNGEVELASKRSTNFLTGKVIEQAYRNNKPASSRTRQVEFPAFSLADFDAFYPRYEP
ncbi:hypothetical protein G8A07_01010 [Roseateles sp. DAIF2]|uniref:hypothetical protein n=1 Tax=Roseateles sp. DAIF2 TaxID=2714952 RepID=UPI0018A26D51|nr:hypothetical protein [Roseateles sp. DAIF2]QPF71644.1 hypothetical protein G8A07_01010 [Roseateles sp. DAIF2]